MNPMVVRRFPVVASSATWVLVLAIAMLFPTSSLAEEAPQDAIKVQADVIYLAERDVVLTMDIYAPPAARSAPAVLVAHGGAWKDGDKADWEPEGLALAEAGFVAFVANYRLAPPNGTWHAIAPVADLRAAVQWIRANAEAHGVDPNAVGALGASSGGNLAMMVGMTGRPGMGKADAVASWSGSTQLALADGNGVWNNRENYVGCAFTDCPDRWTYASPYFRADAKDAPTYLAHSTEEFIVVEEATSMAEKLTTLGVPNELRILEGTRHGRAYEEDVWEETLAFLLLHLTGEAP
jgi:acetyl esterase